MVQGSLHRPNPLMLWTLVLGLLLASIMPGGTMATRTADGSLVIELCTPDGVTRVALAADGTATPLPDDPDRVAAMPDCAWAAAHAVSAMTPVLGWSLHQPDQTSATRPTTVAHTAYIAPAPRHIQSRAPPVAVI